MTKIVINKCWGGFSLSRNALHELRKMGNKYALEETDDGEKYPDGDTVRGDFERQHGFTAYDSYLRDIPRDDPDFVKIAEEKGSDWVSGKLANLVVVEIPDDVEWEIHEYDGMESVEEKHRSWG
jgi:hypothetical protein